MHSADVVRVVHSNKSSIFVVKNAKILWILFRDTAIMRVVYLDGLDPARIRTVHI